MYNGIGLTTPRGSGTSGYVVRNLSTLRSHDTSYDRASPWDAAPPKHREPDQGILEHERKRNVELKCLELQLKLEDDEYACRLFFLIIPVLTYKKNRVDEDDIQVQVAALRAKLLANLAAQAPAAKGFKPSDTHGMALAKKAELSKMARAFGTRSDYQEGESFDREKQEENKIKRMAEREERERQKAEERARMNEQKTKWEAEKREKDRLRRREEDRIRKEREAGGLKRKERDMPPPPLPSGPRYGSRPREYRGQTGRGGSERTRSPGRRMPPPPPPKEIRRSSRSPPRVGDRHRRVSRSRSPPPRVRRRFVSRSPSRSPGRSRSRSPATRRSRSPVPRKSRSRSPVRRRIPSSVRDRSLSRSRSPLRRSGTPPPPSRRERSPPPTPPLRTRERSSTPPDRSAFKKGRSRSASTGSSMSVSTRSGSGSRSRSRGRSLSRD